MKIGSASVNQILPIVIFYHQVPPGVGEHDWAILKEKKPSPDELARSVVRIIEGVGRQLKEDLSTEKESAYSPETCLRTSAANVVSDPMVANDNFDALPSTPRPNKLSLSIHGHDDVSRSPRKRKTSVAGKSPKSPKIFKGKKL